jgi:hypothetical protein
MPSSVLTTLEAPLLYPRWKGEFNQIAEKFLEAPKVES